MRGQFYDATQENYEKEQKLTTEKDHYHQLVKQIEQEYGKLETLMRQTTDQQVQTLRGDLKEEENNTRQFRNNLLKTQAELEIAKDMMKRIQNELNKLVPPPDIEVAAFRPDGRIILIDDQRKIVHLSMLPNDFINVRMFFHRCGL